MILENWHPPLGRKCSKCHRKVGYIWQFNPQLETEGWEQMDMRNFLFKNVLNNWGGLANESWHVRLYKVKLTPQLQKLFGRSNSGCAAYYSIVNVNILLMKAFTHTHRTSDRSTLGTGIYTHHWACTLSGGLMSSEFIFKLLFRLSWKSLDQIISMVIKRQSWVILRCKKNCVIVCWIFFEVSWMFLSALWS